MRRLLLLVPLLALAVSRTADARADDWPQWLGPQRDGVWRETGILDKFPKAGRRRAGACRSAAATPARPWPTASVYVTDRVLAAGAKNPDNPFKTSNRRRQGAHLCCLNESDGKVLWKQIVPLHLPNLLSGRPADHADRRRRQGLHPGGHGRSVLLDAANGKVALVEELRQGQGLQGAGADVGLRRPPAARRRQADLPGRRQGQRRRRLRQGHRQGKVAGAVDGDGTDRLLSADDLTRSAATGS